MKYLFVCNSSRAMTFACLLLLVSGACNGDGSFGPRTIDGLYRLTSTNVGALADASAHLMRDGRMSIRRDYVSSSGDRNTYATTAFYELRGDTLFVSFDAPMRTALRRWVQRRYPLGSLRGDSLTLTYTGPADEYILEHYRRQ